MRQRFAAQLLAVDAQNRLRNRVVEQEDDLLITNIFDLSLQQAETANTLFYDGIISPFPILLPSEVMLGEKVADTLIYTQNQSWLADRLKQFTLELRMLAGKDLQEIFELYVFCSDKLLRNKSEIAVGQKSSLVLWQNTDMKNMLMTPELQLKLLSPSF